MTPHKPPSNPHDPKITPTSPNRVRSIIRHLSAPVRGATARTWTGAAGLVAGSVAPVVANGGNWRQAVSAGLGALALALGGGQLFRGRGESEEE